MEKYSTDKIAILLATYQGENYIEEQLNSLINQSYKEWVVYVHDDGSRDKTPEILKKYEKEYPEKIKIVGGPSTGGAKKNFLYLTSCVEAKYYMCCDQDDVWMPKKIEKTLEAMKKLDQDEDTPYLVFTDLMVVDRNLKTISPSMNEYQTLDCNKLTLNRELVQNVVTGCTMMFNRTLRDKMLQYNNVDALIMHDWWAALIAAEFGKMYFLPEATIMYRQHGDNSVGAKDSKKLSYLVSKMMDGGGIKESLLNTRIQAKEFSEVFEKNKESLAGEYGNISEKSKLKRILFYRKNDIKKSGWKRTIGLYIYG